MMNVSRHNTRYDPPVLYPVGTKVRLHKYGGTYMYSAASYVAVPTTWTKYEAEIQGECAGGNCGYDTWRKGTRYIRLMMLLNYRQVLDSNIILIDDLRAYKDGEQF